MMKLALCSPMLIMGTLLLILPNMTRRRILFTVPVSDTFRNSPEARKAITLYRTLVALALALGLLLTLALPLTNFTALAPIVLFAIGLLAFYKARRMVAPFATPIEDVRSFELSDAPDRLPRFAWLSIGPFLVLGAGALALHAYWDRIPQSFPVHWGIDGAPNRWAEKSATSVYGPLVFAAETCAWLTALGLAGWFGARRSSLRPKLLSLSVMVQYGMSLLFTSISLQATLGAPMWIALTTILLTVTAVIVVVMRLSAQPSDPPEKTPENCWKSGMIYYNPNDAAVLVEKRTGLGYTFNFANRWSWLLLAGLPLIMITAPFLLR